MRVGAPSLTNPAARPLRPLLPTQVPFHITTLKSIALNQDNDHAYIRVCFNFMWVQRRSQALLLGC